MKKQRVFDDVLNECVDRVLKGVSVEACLRAFPEYAAELEPLLQTAVDTRKAAAVVPRPEFRQRAGYEFQAAIRDMRPLKRGVLRWQVRLVTALSLVFIILIAGTGTVAAASNSLPDQPLYPVKLATENVRLTLTPSALGKAELYTEFTDTRVDEIVKMADKGKVAQVEKATERMNAQLGAIAKLALPTGEVDTASIETPTALMAPAINTPAPAQGMAPAATPTPTPPAAVKASPVPAPTPPENKGQVAPSANISSSRTTAQQETKPTQAPSAATASALKSEGKGDNANQEKQQADLKNTVSHQAEKNTQQLEDVLKRVPDNVKPALKKAIDTAGKGYDEALKNIDHKK